MNAEIIVVKYGQPELERRCIRSVRKHTNLRKHSLTVVDNYKRDKNLGALWNELIERRSTDFVCLLNSDTEVEPGWLDTLIRAAESTDADAVGPMTNHCGTAQQRGLRGTDLVETATLSGFCLLVRRSAWVKAKGFREDFTFYGQESNFLRRVGRKIICKSVHVSHVGGASVKATGRAQEEQSLGREIWKRNLSFDWSKRLAIIGAGPGNPFPLHRGVDEAIREFAREGMEARHFWIQSVSAQQLGDFNPDAVVVINSGGTSFLRFAHILHTINVPKGLWVNDLRDHRAAVCLRTLFDRLFLCFKSDDTYSWPDWERESQTPISYMPQGSRIVPELIPLDVQRQSVFVGDLNNQSYHRGRREAVRALGAFHVNGITRERRAQIEGRTPVLYRQSHFSLVMSPEASGYNSLRLYNVLAYGGLALVRRFPGMERLFSEGRHLLGWSDLEEAQELMRVWSGRADECEEIRRRGWRYQQAKHTVAARLMNITANLTTEDASFWGYA